MHLTADQEERIVKYLDSLSSSLKGELSNTEWIRERKEKHNLFSKLLSENNIANLREKEFGKIIKSLWAINGWTNKDWVVNNLIKNNGFTRIRNSLKELLYGPGTLEKRFDNFKVKGLGTSMVTEILAFVDPANYSLWNEKPRKVFPILGIDQIPDSVYKNSQISGSDYVKCNEIMKEISKVVSSHGFGNINFLDLDIFIWLIFSKTKNLRKEKKSEAWSAITEEEVLGFNRQKMTHWDAIGVLVELGKTLGFETYVADPARKYKGKSLRDWATSKDVPDQCKSIPQIERVDVIWFSFQPPFYLFEVEDGGTMREALHRLYQARFFESKFFIVSPIDNRDKFEKYVTTDPFKSIQNKYLFRSYDELIMIYLMAKNYHVFQTRFFGE